MNYFEQKSRQIIDMINEGCTQEEIIDDLFDGVRNRYKTVMRKCFSADFREKCGRKLAYNKMKANKKEN